MRAAYVFGFGLGGLADGIVLHQVLQWHHLVSARRSAATLEGLEDNTLADGIFHVVVLAVLVLGAVLLLREARTARAGWSRSVVGGTLVGFGAFHLVDALVFHALLGLHHLRMVEDHLVYDLAGAGIGVVLVAAGAAIRQRAGEEGGRS